MTILRALLFLIAFVGCASAQNYRSFDNYFNALPPATTPLAGTEPMIVFQGGTTKQVPASQLSGVVGAAIPSYTSPTALAAATISVTTNVVFVTSVSGTAPPPVSTAKGQSFCGLTYIRGTGTPTGQYGEILNTVSGIYWEPNYSTAPVRTCEFGAIGDGNLNQTTSAVNGTDNTAFIQAAIDYALRNSFNTVCLNDGSYVTSDTLQMGWGQTFYTLSLVACNNGTFGFYEQAGVTILPTKTDRCAVNIQGGRADKIENITFIGQNFVWMFNSSFFATGAPFPQVDSGWLNPALIPSGSNPGGLQQHSPYAAICIDAYKGAQPTDHYPTVTYPAWTGINTQYNKAASSNTQLIDVEVLGFGVGIMSSPNGDGNGDFDTVDRLDCEATVYCFSIGNTQSRNNNLTNFFGNLVYTLITNNTNGLQQGILGGLMSNLAVGFSYQLFKISTPLIAFAAFHNIYSEATVQIGSIVDGGGNAGGTIFIDGCNINLDDNETQVVPDALIHQASQASVTLFDCSISAASRGEVLAGGNDNIASLFVNGGRWNQLALKWSTLSPDAAHQGFVNYTGGIYTGNATTFPTFIEGQAKWGNATTGDFYPTAAMTPVGSQLMSERSADGAVRNWVSQASTYFIDQFNFKKWLFAGPPGGKRLPSFVSVSYTSCDTVVGQYASGQQLPATPYAGTILVGDLIYQKNSSTLFVVTNVGALSGGNYPITMQQINNMVINRTTGACVTSNNSDPTLGGNLVLTHIVSDLPSYVFFGTFTSGSPSVTNIQRGDGYGGNLDTYVQNGDMIFSYSQGTGGVDTYFQWPYAYGTTLSAVTDGSPGSMTLSKNALVSGRFPILPFPIMGGPQ